MKAILICAVVVLLVSGCTTVTYNPRTGDVTYTRIGSLKAKDILIEFDGVHVEIGSTESDATEFIKKMIEIGIDIGKTGI